MNDTGWECHSHIPGILVRHNNYVMSLGAFLIQCEIRQENARAISRLDWQTLHQYDFILKRQKTRSFLAKNHMHSKGSSHLLCKIQFSYSKAPILLDKSEHFFLAKFFTLQSITFKSYVIFSIQILVIFKARHLKIKQMSRPYATKRQKRGLAPQ